MVYSICPCRYTLPQARESYKLSYSLFVEILILFLEYRLCMNIFDSAIKLQRHSPIVHILIFLYLLWHIRINLPKRTFKLIIIFLRCLALLSSLYFQSLMVLYLKVLAQGLVKWNTQSFTKINYLFS